MSIRMNLRHALSSEHVFALLFALWAAGYLAALKWPQALPLWFWGCSGLSIGMALATMAAKRAHRHAHA